MKDDRLDQILEDLQKPSTKSYPGERLKRRNEAKAAITQWRGNDVDRDYLTPERSTDLAARIDELQRLEWAREQDKGPDLFISDYITKRVMKLARDRKSDRQAQRQPKAPGHHVGTLSAGIDELLTKYFNVEITLTGGLGPEHSIKRGDLASELARLIEAEILKGKIEELKKARECIPQYQPKPIQQLEGQTAYNEYIKERIAVLEGQMGAEEQRPGTPTARADQVDTLSAESAGKE